MNKVQLNFKGRGKENGSNIKGDDSNDGSNNIDSEALCGELTTENGKLRIGMAKDEFLPYPMLMGALGSCLYSTFLDIVKKMRLEFDSCTLDIQWEKRTETPTTCKLILIKASIKDIDMDKKSRFNKAFELATEYCSIYSTMSHVAEIKWELSFE